MNNIMSQLVYHIPLVKYSRQEQMSTLSITCATIALNSIDAAGVA